MFPQKWFKQALKGGEFHNFTLRLKISYISIQFFIAFAIEENVNSNTLWIDGINVLYNQAQTLYVQLRDRDNMILVSWQAKKVVYSPYPTESHIVTLILLRGWVVVQRK